MGTTTSGLLAPLTRLASVFGLPTKAQGEPDSKTQPRLADPYTGLYNRRGLALKGDALLARLKHEGLPACVVQLDCAELRTVRDICGRGPARKLLCHVAARVVRLVGARGLAARSESTQFTLVLPGTRDEVAQAIEAEFGNPPRIGGAKASGLRMLNLSRVSIKEIPGAVRTAPALRVSVHDQPSSGKEALFLDSTSAMPLYCAATQPARLAAS